MVIITPQIKDKILTILLSAESPRFIFQYRDSEGEFGISPQYVKMILDHFAELGLIKITHFLGGSAQIVITTKAMDLHRHGGFTGEEEILKANIEKLGLELESLAKTLSPNHLEQASHISQIGSAILQALSLFH